MQRYLVPAVVLASLALMGPAFAAQTTGTVKSFDAKAHTLTLKDGVVYYLPTGFKDPGLKPGKKVSITWEMKSNQHQASNVTIAK